jgi:hypothetical protein
VHPVLAVEVGRLHCSFISAEISDLVNKLISYFKKVLLMEIYILQKSINEMVFPEHTIFKLLLLLLLLLFLERSNYILF